MEDTESRKAAVHVLRHSFRPSEQLGVAIDNFMSGGVTRPRFLYASKMIAIDFSKHSSAELRPLITRTQGGFLRREHDRIRLGGEFAASKRKVLGKILANGALRLGFLPLEKAPFDALLAPIDDLPNDQESTTIQTVYVHADIAARDLRAKADIPAQLARLHEALSDDTQGRQYTIQPSGIDERPL